MNGVAESDWKLFKKMLPQWQERFMERLIDQYIEILNGSGEASDRFWALEKRIKRDKLCSGVIVNDLRRSTMRYEIANLLSDNAITLDDLDGFPEDVKSYGQHWIGQKEHPDQKTSPAKRGQTPVRQTGRAPGRERV
mgnify:CR=1 FL=1